MDDPYMTNARPKVRNLVGVFILIFGLIIYAFAAAALGDWIEELGLSLWIQMPYYLLAGILWLLPARSLINWIGKGNAEK